MHENLVSGAEEKLSKKHASCTPLHCGRLMMMRLGRLLGGCWEEAAAAHWRLWEEEECTAEEKHVRKSLILSDLSFS
jgi:hypothetical protein